MQGQERSRGRLLRTGIVPEQLIDGVTEKLHAHRDYFDSVLPECFLHDTTTKNVIIEGGVLRGIVDVDDVAFGDPLLVLGLTQMALLSDGYELEYTDHWKQQLELSPDQERALALYTAMFCLDFLSEMGQRFNRDEPEPIDEQRRDHLLKILDGLT